MARVIERLQSALAHQRRGDHAKALTLLEAALDTEPNHPDAHHLTGLSLQAQGRSVEALAAIRKAIAAKPDEPMFHTNAGVVAVAAGDMSAGIEHYRRALEIDPNYADACNNLGVALHKLGRSDQALVALRRALEIDPRHVSALVNMGDVLHGLGRELESIESYGRAIAIAPNIAEAHNNLGNSQKAILRYDDAIASFDRALALRPDFSEAWFNRGIALAIRGDTEQAADSYARAIAIKPDPRYRLADAGLLPVVPRSIAEIERWRKRFLTRIAALYEAGEKVAGMPIGTPLMDFHLAYHGKNDRDIMVLLSALLRQMYPDLIWTTPHTYPSPASDGGRRIRLGIFSSYLRQHAVVWTMEGLIAGLPKDRFDITLYSSQRTQGPIMPAIAEAAERIVLLPASVPQAREVIADARHDVLLFADIGMESLSYGLANARLAPVQCVIWGHPVTTGIPTVDYYLSNDLSEPDDADAHYSERLVRLDGVQTCYRRPAVPAREGLSLPAGIPEDATVYLCAQSLFKIHPAMDRLLFEILRRDPNGVLILFEGTDRVITERLRERLSAVFGSTMDRVHILPRVPFERFMEIMVLSDVLLDTWPFGSGNTSYQGFAAGTPIVTLPCESLRGLGVMAHYRHMGIDDCVAKSPEDFTDIAVRLGTDAAFRKRIEDLIRDRSAVLFDDQRVVDDLARFLIEVTA
jgi:protein O-GlcNAc transferase